MHFCTVHAYGVMVNVLMHLQPGEQIHGEVAHGGGDAVAFAGWHELVGTLERLRAEQPSDARAVSPLPLDRPALQRDLNEQVEQPLVLAALKLRSVLGLLDAEPEQARSLLDQLPHELDHSARRLRELRGRIYRPT